MQTAGDLVPFSAELAAGVEHGHDRLERGDFCLGVDVDRNAAAVVGDADEAVGQKHDFDVVAEPAHRLVAAVIENLPNEMVQTVRPGGADVHAWPAAHRLEPLEHCDLIRPVIPLLRFWFVFFSHNSGRF